jgi:RNA ligase
MNYQFPAIKCLDDVLPAIAGRDEFIVAVKDGDYTVINYAVAFDDTFPPVQTIYDAIRRECRGLIFRTSTGEILHRRLHKFFNANEKDETQIANIRWDKPHVILEKLDGSMITPVLTSEGLRWGTKMGVTDVALPVEEFVVDHNEYTLLVSFMDQRGYTPIFEWCSRKQRIVIDYPEDQLVLIAARNNITGEYMPYQDLGFAARKFKIPLVKQYEGNAQNMTDLVAEITDLEGAEGFVIRFESGHMVKVKGRWYVQLHKTKDNLSREKNVIELLVTEKADDIKAFMLEEDRKRFEQFEHDFWTNVQVTANDMQLKFDANKDRFVDKRDYAVNFVQKEIDDDSRKFFYSMWDGKKVFELLKEHISNNCGTQTKVDDVRWIFNCNWNYAQTEE